MIMMAKATARHPTPPRGAVTTFLALATMMAVGVSALPEGQLSRPQLALQFSSKMRLAQGYGHNGDGCVIAEAALRSEPVVSRVWFDAPGERLAMTNPGYARVDPRPNLTVIGRFDEQPPLELDISRDPGARGGYSCTEEPLPPSYCPNGTKACPPTFGTWGELFTPFSNILGVYYLNTSLLSSTAESDLWQWGWTQPTRMPNGTFINVTRNYTYAVGRTAAADGTRPLHRFTWTQSIPLQPAQPVHRDCFIIDYTSEYRQGRVDASRFEAPPGVACTPGDGRLWRGSEAWHGYPANPSQKM